MYVKEVQCTVFCNCVKTVLLFLFFEIFRNKIRFAHALNLTLVTVVLALLQYIGP